MASFIILIIIILILHIINLLKRRRHFRYIRKAKKVLKKLAQIQNFGQKMCYLRKVNPFVFEEMILISFKNQGYKIFRNQKYTGDGGIDGRVKINRQWCLIQAKRYSNHINLQHVEDFKSICLNKHTYGFFIHTGRTSSKIKEISEKKDSVVTIISGDKLLKFFE